MKKIINFYVVMFCSLLLTGIEGTEELEIKADYNGLNMVSQYGHRIVDKQIKGDDPHQTNLCSVSWLCRQLVGEDNEKISYLNLSNNNISNAGAQMLGAFLKKSEILPNLQIIDLSFNKLKEDSLIYFSDLLLRDNFKYLVIYGNEGADSKQALQSVDKELSARLNAADGRSYQHLRKIIWVPENSLNENNKDRYYNSKSHKKYYQSQKVSK
jgi:hypothetical protein